MRFHAWKLRSSENNKMHFATLEWKSSCSGGCAVTMCAVCRVALPDRFWCSMSQTRIGFSSFRIMYRRWLVSGVKNLASIPLGLALSVQLVKCQLYWGMHMHVLLIKLYLITAFCKWSRFAQVSYVLARVIKKTASLECICMYIIMLVWTMTVWTFLRFIT